MNLAISKVLPSAPVRRIDMSRQPLFRTLLGTIALVTAVQLPPAKAQGRPNTNSSAPVHVIPFQGQYCASLAPQGWFVVAENAQRSAFGADFSSADGKATAGFSIFPAGTIGSIPGSQTPDGAVAASLSSMGSVRLQFGQRMQLGPNVFLVSYRAAQFQGAAFYQVIPEGRGAYLIVMRSANVAAGYWGARGPEASAVARAVRCQVPNVPASPDPPSLNAKPRRGGAAETGEGDSFYNQWLDKETYDNAATGENFWVIPSRDWQQNGPNGPGYYAKHGNSIVKLESGYSQ